MFGEVLAYTEKFSSHWSEGALFPALSPFSEKSLSGRLKSFFSESSPTFVRQCNWQMPKMQMDVNFLHYYYIILYYIII